MKKKAAKIQDRILDLFSDEEDSQGPAYDPAHLGGVLVLAIVGIGAIYWMLWTLLVYGGGLPSKIGPALSVLFTSATLADVGYRGSPHAMGPFEGWVGNCAALFFCVLTVGALHRLYKDASRRRR